MILMKDNKIKVSQRCCEWLATLEIFEMYCSLPPLVMTELIPNEQYDALRDAINTILDGIETHLVCFATTSVLFTQPQVDVLAKLMDVFDDAMMGILVKGQANNPEKHIQLLHRIGLIKRNLRRNEQTTHFTIESPCGGNDTHYAGSGRESCNEEAALEAGRIG